MLVVGIWLILFVVVGQPFPFWLAYCLKLVELLFAWIAVEIIHRIVISKVFIIYHLSNIKLRVILIFTKMKLRLIYRSPYNP